MTCIVGLIENGIAYMGGDSALSMGWTRDTLSMRKIFNVNRFMIGFCGDWRMANIMQHHLNIAPQMKGESDEHYVVVALIDNIRHTAKEMGQSTIDKNHESISGSFLVAYKGQLYSIGSDFSVATVTGNLYACGSGAEVALGAMVALSSMEPKARIKRALEISAQFIASVAAPFYVETQQAKKKKQS